MGFNELTEREKVECAKAYDKYIQQANEEDKYFDGWKPVCLDEFADNEWKEVCDLERICKNICCEYFGTVSDEEVYEAYDEEIVAVRVNFTFNESYPYRTWRELYENCVFYEIESDERNIGLKDIKGYLDAEAFEFVCKDFRWDYESTAESMELFEAEKCSKCDKKSICEIDGYACEFMEELNDRLGVL